MPKPHPSEFRDDVVRVARNREPGVTIEQIAKDFGVHTMTWQKWLQPAAVDDGARPGQSRTESVELREARKRIRLLEQEYEVLRRAAAYLSQANLPGKGSTRSRKSSPLKGSLSRWRWGTSRRERSARGNGFSSSPASPTTGGWPAPSPTVRWWRRIARMRCSTRTATTSSSVSAWERTDAGGELGEKAPTYYL